MSQDDIDDFVASARQGTLTPGGVTTAVVSNRIPVNGWYSVDGYTALHCAVNKQRREVVVALLAAGADANVKDYSGETSVLVGAIDSTADIVQLLIDCGGSVNEAANDGQTPLIAVVSWNFGDAAARLSVLLACGDLDLDAKYDGKTAEEWAVERRRNALASAIAAEVRL
jgi:ankyrin repeat protein